VIYLSTGGCALPIHGDVKVSTGRMKLSVQDRGQRGSVKTLEFIIANDNVEFDYAQAA